tara:strand:+ start:311 stop:430 length:120 start_codon:yes stop_codon:yes gene_type:complete
MPIRKVKGGWTFGGRLYKKLVNAKKSYRAYLAKKNTRRK